VTKHRQTIGNLFSSAAAMSISVHCPSQNPATLRERLLIRSRCQNRIPFHSLPRHRSPGGSVLRKPEATVTPVDLPGGPGHMDTIDRTSADSSPDHRQFLTRWILQPLISSIRGTSTVSSTVAMHAEQPGARIPNDLWNTTLPVSKNNEVQNA